MELLILQILDLLENKRPIAPEKTETAFEKMARQLATILRWAAAASFALIAGLAMAAFMSLVERPSALKAVERTYLVLLVTSLVALTCEILPMCIALFRFKHDSYRRRRLELLHDFDNANSFMHFDATALALADRWIAQKIERMKLHAGFFLGGTEKISVIALIAGGWAIWKAFPGDETTLIQGIYYAGGAFLGGLGLGGLLISTIMRRLAYHRDLLSIAIYRLQNP